MQSFVFVVAVLSLAVVASVQAKCEGGCPVSVAHYEEIGCEPVFAQPGDCCPSHYTCAKFKARAADKCYVKGKKYNKGDRIDDSITASSCRAGCSCSKNAWGDITCANIECAETFGARPLAPGCYRTYNLDSCCSKEIICPPFDKLAKCEVEGKSYKQGEKWYPENTNLKCVCQPGFKGKLEAPFCAEISCGIEFSHTQSIKNKCAPVFYGPKKGCPFQWECLKEGDVVVPKGTTSKQKCHYGQKTLNVGDKLLLKQDPSSPKIDCECKIPPLITCIQEPYKPEGIPFIL